METIEIIKKRGKKDGKTRLRFRLRDGAKFKSYLYHKSDMFIDSEDLDRLSKNGSFIKNARKISPELVQLQENIVTEMNAMKRAYSKLKDSGLGINSINFEMLVKTELNPEDTSMNHNTSFFDALMEFIQNKKFSEGSRSRFKVLYRTLKRFELYRKTPLDFDSITSGTLREFESYLTKEHTYYNEVEASKETGKLTYKAKTFQQIMDAVPESRKPVERGRNTIHNLMKEFRTFLRWANGLDKEFKPDCQSKRYTTNNPFDDYPVVSENYGTPFYLTIEERNKLYEAELPEHLKKQRDIFVFQCVIGCRVSDLWAMTKANVINGGIEYIARKTKEKNPETTRVILNKVALEILDRYKEYDGTTLFPFTSQQHYNLDIKEMIRLAGIDRMVTVLNPLTGEEEKRPIYEVASSHMARRTFIGNLYKKVKDPNLIGSMTGHVEGSRSFARYRDIDDDVKKETVMLLE